MFDRAEILVVGAEGSERAHLAATAMRVRLERAGLTDQYRLHTVVLPGLTDSAAVKGGGLPVEATGPGGSRASLSVDEWIERADLVLATSCAQRGEVETRFPGAQGKAVSLADVLSPAGGEGGQQAWSDGVETLPPLEVAGLVENGFEAILRHAEVNRTRTMARVGLSTSLFLSEQVPPPLENTVALIARAGVSWADWSHDALSDPVYTGSEMDRFAELFDAKGIRCEQIHGFETEQFNPVSTGEALDRYVEIQGNRVELCARLGGDTVVVHIPGNHSTAWDGRGLPMDEEMEYSTIALDRLRPVCERLGVTIAVENSGVVRYDRDCERLDFYLSRYPASYITFCLDVGHANRHGAAALEGLKPYASRLSALHLHDNRGVEDDHQPPLFGSIDWRELLGWLCEIGYDRSLNFELLFDRRLFSGGHAEFVAHATRCIRQALNKVPGIRLSPVGRGRA